MDPDFPDSCPIPNLSDTDSDNIVTSIKHFSDSDDFSSSKSASISGPARFVRVMSANRFQADMDSDNTMEYEYAHICPQYYDIISFAQYFVDDILAEAEGVINKQIDEPTSLCQLPIMETKHFLQRYSDIEIYPVIEYERPKFSGWPTIEEFTIALGADKIDEYLSSFDTNEEWLYIIYYLGCKTEGPSTLYEYEAIWSLPCREYPIPQATASVFFTIEVSNVLPKTCLVNVTFTFESYQFKHTPGITDFNEEYLNYILDAKINVFKKIKY